MKKILLFFTAMCCMMAANAQTQPDNEIWYTSADGQVVSPYDANAFEVKIVTNVYDTKTNKGCITFDGIVTGIGTNAFYKCTNMTSITLPSALTSIGFQAFRSCTGLTGINIPNGVTGIGNYAFQDCTNLTEINIPGSVTGIGNYAFQDCTNLTEINIPGSVKSIGQGAFEGCTSLLSIELQSGLMSIGTYVFEDCTSLTGINIPGSVTSIGAYAFINCTGLTNMIVFAQNPPQLGINVFYSVPANIPVYVPDANVYSSNEGWNRFNFNFKNIDDDVFAYKQKTLYDINVALQGITLSDDETTAVNELIQTVKDATTIEDATTAKNAALAIISQAAIRPVREAALAAIEAAMQGETGAYLTGLVQSYIDTINASTDETSINNAKNAAVTVLNAVMTAYKAGKASPFGEKQNGHALIVTNKEGKEFILYAPKKVEYIKVNE